MNLDTALDTLAYRFHLDAAALRAYAAEDPHTGWGMEGDAWPCGSLWTVEGRALYALVRALKPAVCVELGTHHGASATHIAQALHDNGGGTLYAIDPWEGAGAGIPTELRPYIVQVFADGVEWVQRTDLPLDFVFEDALHGADQVEAIWRAALGKLTPGGVIVSHDAMHASAGADVRRGIMRAGIGDFLTLLIEPSDCGLAAWRHL